MTFIPCDERCIHQEEGFCTLDTPMPVAEVSHGGCIYKTRPESPISFLSRKNGSASAG